MSRRERAVDSRSLGRLSSASTLIDLMLRNAEADPDRVGMREKRRGIWVELTWGEMARKVLWAAAALEKFGFEVGDAVIVLGDNRIHLYLGMLAAMALRGQPMPVYTGMTIRELRYFSSNARVVAAFAEDQEQVDKLLELRETGVNLRHIIYDDPRGLTGYTAHGLVAWTDLLSRGQEIYDSNMSVRESLAGRVRPEDTAAFLHSSGTTGNPKPIILTHRNVIACIQGARRADMFGDNEEILAYLPMAWAGDFILSIVGMIAFCFVVNVPEDQETVLNDIREIEPTLYFAAPRSWDNLLTLINVRMQSATPLKKNLFSFLLAKAMEIERQRLQGYPRGIIARFWKLAGEWLVFAPLRDHFGMNRIRNAFTGGEALGEDTFIFYRAIGIRLRQLYGQTEISAFATVQSPENIKLHTVGRPLPGVEVKIDETGEILVRSESVFAGNGGADKWLRTGDAGYFDDNELVVLGRLSDVVYTKAGKRFVPNYIENRLKFSPYIKDAAIIGAGQDELVAMICTDFQPLSEWAEQQKIPYISYADLSQRPEVAKLIKSDIERVNDVLVDELRIRRFVSLPKEFDPDDGEITRTRKLRRNVIESRYEAVVKALFDGSTEIAISVAYQYESGETGTIERTLAVWSI